MNEIANAVSTGTFAFSEPDVLFLIVPTVIVLALILIKSFVAIDKRRLHDPKFIRSRRYYRIFMFITRTIIFALLFIALADPYGEVKKDIPGDLSVTMLIDNSSSMELFDTSFTESLRSDLEQYLPVKVA
ncbi:hypothetical protein KY362_06740, partial [Candidatus Woesearchaeota archaeon]|nr:hypothetical protein [Candidatus Woesearchaeota archaeon]